MELFSEIPPIGGIFVFILVQVVIIKNTGSKSNLVPVFTASSKVSPSVFLCVPGSLHLAERITT